MTSRLRPAQVCIRDVRPGKPVANVGFFTKASEIGELMEGSKPAKFFLISSGQVEGKDANQAFGLGAPVWGPGFEVRMTQG